MDLDAGGEETRPGGNGGDVHDQSPDREPEAQGGSRGDEPVRPEELEVESEEFDGQPPQGARAPYQPTAREVEEHNLTHCPPRAWCDHCVKGQCKDRAHRTVKGDEATSEVPRINLDYFTLKGDVTTETSEHEDRSTARVSMTCMCMLESMCQSVWGYAVKQKGAGEEWLVA